jgi:hypothetical protein
VLGLHHVEIDPAQLLEALTQALTTGLLLDLALHARTRCSQSRAHNTLAQQRHIIIIMIVGRKRRTTASRRVLARRWRLTGM